MLAGTLTLPPGDGPFPAAVLLAGSGPNDRDETILRHKLFLVLADDLTRRGIAVLRYDKRGIGKSTGDYALATSRDFADDARAAFLYLKTQPHVNAAKVGLIGHSEGGIIAPMVAAQSPDVAFLVLLAGTGVPGERIIAEQSALIGKAEGASDSDVAQSQVLEKKGNYILDTPPPKSLTWASLATSIPLGNKALRTQKVGQMNAGASSI